MHNPHYTHICSTTLFIGPGAVMKVSGGVITQGEHDIGHVIGWYNLISCLFLTFEEGICHHRFSPYTPAQEPKSRLKVHQYYHSKNQPTALVSPLSPSPPQLAN